MVARLAHFGGRKAVNGLGKDARASGFTHPSWTAKEVCVRQLSTFNRVFQRGGKGRLPHHRVERHGSVFARRYDIFSHKMLYCVPFYVFGLALGGMSLAVWVWCFVPRFAKLRIIFVFSFGSCLFIVSLFLCFGGVVSLTHLK